MMAATHTQRRRQLALQHPVARATGRAAIDSAVQSFLVRVYLLREGELMQADGVAAWKVLAVAVRVLELRGQIDCPDSRVMQGAMRAMEQCAQRHWKWRRMDAPAIDAGLQRAATVAKGAQPAELQTAWRHVLALLGQTCEVVR